MNVPAVAITANDPAPLTVANKSTLALAEGGPVFGSVWRATQARSAATTADAASLHVIELAELVA